MPLPTAQSATPLMIEAAGFPLPPLYRKIMEASWTSMGPWAFLRGEAFLSFYRDVNAVLAARHEQDPAGAGARVVLPFATCATTGTIACLQVIPTATEVILMRAEQILAILPSFESWLRMALDDLIRAVDEPCSPTQRIAERPAPLPFESQPEEERDPRSSTRRHLLRVLRESEVDLNFVAVEAGDQPLSSASVRRQHELIKRERGQQIYADMLSILTQQRYPSRMAKWLWGKIIQHRESISQRLGRRAEITVASLDFLNQHEHLVEGSLVLCSEDEMAQVAEVALRDGLTGLFDHETFRVRLNRELERATRYAAPLSLLMLDLDHFKLVNDEHGHLEGDRVLSVVGELLADELRSVDLAARYGGEEFTVLLPETGPREAEQLAQRLGRAVERRFMNDLQVTVSIGAASFPDEGPDAEALIHAADAALYRSKALGRNTVTSASSL